MSPRRGQALPHLSNPEPAGSANPASCQETILQPFHKLPAQSFRESGTTPVIHHLQGWKLLHLRRHSDQQEHETRKPPLGAASGKTRKRDPMPPACTGGSKIASSGRGRT